MLKNIRIYCSLFVQPDQLGKLQTDPLASEHTNISARAISGFPSIITECYSLRYVIYICTRRIHSELNTRLLLIHTTNTIIIILLPKRSYILVAWLDM